ncbi:Hsp70 family protein [Actinokineospora spheciospongiae]|uniref:Hsp70 family protein n=1 Tax=Actinokineospora spheciospongiae TaxID=909613 RepID=UPI000D71459C|nr:Hsp70 family protein [Actinokineospora spheciospongiae]PWW67021.1 Hsp70 protein [Actinokineospora spheciospongiae]
MRYGLGIDLGTTFTAAAVASESGTRMVPLGDGVITPSVVYAAAEGALITGDVAEAVGRSDPARLARGHKRRLGDPTPLVLSGAAYSPAALLAAQLRDVVAFVGAQEGGAPSSVVLTCPAVWGPYRREHFDEVPRLADLPAARIVTEPEAAATHYSVERRLGDGELVAVYDLGGGTFDTTILRARAGGMEILGTPEGIERLGGMDFDEALLAHVDARLDGAVSALDPADPETAVALAAIRALCVRAKEDLSVEPDVTLRIPLPSGERELLVTRLEFNDMIRPSVALTTEALHRTISSAGLKPDDLAAVLLAGGSSRIPLVPQMVSAAFGRPVRVGLHPKFTVALGAAAVARQVATSAPPTPPSGLATTAFPAGSSAAPGSSGSGRGRRPKWLVPAAAAAAVLLVATVTTVALTSGGDEDGKPPAVAAGSQDKPTEVKVFDKQDVIPFKSIIGSADNWAGTQLGVAHAATQTAISVEPGKAGTEDGLHTTWTGKGAGQLYFQDVRGGRDMSAYVDAKSALVFDVVVNKTPAVRTTIGVHCEYPCAAEVEATTLFQELPVGTMSTVRIPVSCFIEKGLDPKNVNTFFLVYTEGVFDATFANVRWAPGAAEDPGATRCSDLT